MTLHGQLHEGGYASWDDARNYVRSLGLKNQKEWLEWRRDVRPHRDKVPVHIPRTPETVYPEWVSLRDWLHPVSPGDGPTMAHWFRHFFAPRPARPPHRSQNLKVVLFCGHRRRPCVRATMSLLLRAQ